MILTILAQVYHIFNHFAGNGTLIYIFIKNKEQRNVPNIYIISLALGDLLVLVFTVPFVSLIYTFESWPYGIFACKFSEFVRDVSIGVTVFTLTALSADRYMAIVSPVRKVSLYFMNMINILRTLI